MWRKRSKATGFSLVADKLNWHGKPFSKEQLAAAIAEKGGGPTIRPDPGKSFERTSLPKPAEFGAPAAPDYAKDAKVATREAYGFALKRLELRTRMWSRSRATLRTRHFRKHSATRTRTISGGDIAEQNMVSVAVGSQVRGKTPFADTFACFLSRAYDNVRMAAISRANINLCGSHCGVSIGGGRTVADGARRHRNVPRGAWLGCSVSERCRLGRAPDGSDGTTPGINYLRTSRPKMPIFYSNDEEFPIPGFKVLRKSADDKATVAGAGVTFHEALRAADQLKAAGITVRVIDLYCVKPLDGAALWPK